MEKANFLSVCFSKMEVETLQVLTSPTKADSQREPQQFVTHNHRGKEELMIRLW